MKVPENVKQILDRPLPSEALKPHPSKSYLTTINPIYVVERMNEAFGVGEWRYETEVVESDKPMKVVKCTYTVDKYDIHLEQFGGNDNKDAGDAYKGAATDALTKIGSYLGIGAHVWKDKKSQPQKSAAPEWDKDHFEGLDKVDLGNCKKCGAPNKLSQAGKTYCSSLCWKK